MKKTLYYILFASFLYLGALSCGSGRSDNPNTVTSQPVLMAALPAQGKAGDTITLQGVGFSIAPNEDIIVLGGITLQALTHDFIPNNALPANGASEEITFQIPANAPVGAGNVLVLVNETPTNGVPFTVETP
ncbi:MAG: IPT/TIG domain-containing protein [bacterium]